jgi:MoaA/NifB/PqqE/SkfB family radical SAM enzyme
MPKTLQIDASSHCQLACPSCPTADGSTQPTLGAGHLSLKDFTALLDANPEIEDVELSNYGEMFLNPALPEILRAAFERGVALHADNGVNLNLLRPDALDALIRYRFRSLTVSIEGASSETYAQYRHKGDFDRVIANIRRINEEKRRHQTGFPLLTWQFILFGHNEHEIAAARKMAAELGMGFRAKLSWDDGVSPIRNRELLQIALGTRQITRADHYAATETLI